MSALQTQIHVADDVMTVVATQDCVPIAEWAKERHNTGAHGSNEFRHAARIPQVMVEKYLNDNNITYREWSTDKAHIRRMLQDPALQAFRIWKGAI